MPMSQNQNVKLYAWIGLFGAAGALARAGISLLTASANMNGFPWATWICNIAGCFLLGWWASRRWTNDFIFKGLTTGFAGSFTTFSALSLEALQMLQEGAWFVWFGYTMLSIGVGLAMVHWGMRCGAMRKPINDQDLR